MHEDLICHNSGYFKSRLQRHRNPVSANCAICFDDLDPRTQEITFCDKCGQNFHEGCVNRWSADRTQEGRLATCATCRGAWTDKPVWILERLCLEQELDAEAVQVYLDWLYSSHLNIDTSIPRTTEAFNLVLLRCWEVSTIVEDDAFKDAAIQTFFTDAKAHFWNKSIKFAFEDGKGSDEMRNFVAEIYVSRLDEGWFNVESAKWPDAFVKTLADQCLKATIFGQKRKSFRDIKAAYLRPVDEVSMQNAVHLMSEEEDDIDDILLSILSRNPQLAEKPRKDGQDAKEVVEPSVRTESSRPLSRFGTDLLRVNPQSNRPGRFAYPPANAERLRGLLSLKRRHVGPVRPVPGSKCYN